MKYCTYISIHPTGFWYAGKGITAKVESGAYKGSGVKFKVSCVHPGFELGTWNTIVLEKFVTEAEAFVAEEILVPLEALHDPYCLNIQKGGLKGRGQGHSFLLRMMNAKKRRELKEARALAKKEREKIAKEKQRARNKAWADKVKILKEQQK